MELWAYILIAVGVLLVGGILPMFIFTFPIAKRVYFDKLVRTSPEKWGRVCSAPENEEQLAMWNAGLEWKEQNKHCIKEVSVTSDGFNLYGEYFDFGFDRCVIILPGRCESLIYSYYFAPPYQKAGFNVLVIDTRCHGKSDGKYNTIGIQESKDVIAWAKYVHESFSDKEIYIHGICIGTSSGIFALTRKDCPEYLRGFVTEGCFISFRECFLRHMKEEKKPIFPVLDMIMLLIKKHTGTNVYKNKPITEIKKLNPNLRVLFLYGEKDVFSLPEKSKQLFDACAAKDKKLVWFEKGGHSHLRINNTEQYDAAIVDFFSR